jgi:RNA polymerase sigma-70 factor, ECF subfamily
MKLFQKDLRKKNDAELMLLLRTGSKEAFSVLYGRYSDKLVRFFYRMLNKDLEKARDFMHDIFLKIIENPELYDTDKRFDTWIFHIAYNMCKNEYRKMTIRDEYQESHVYKMPAIEEPGRNKIDHQKFTEELNENLDLLDERHRIVFLLRYQQDLTLKEIAGILDCPEGTVKSRLFYAIKSLSEKLKVFDPKVN